MGGYTDTREPLTDRWRLTLPERDMLGDAVTWA